MESFHVSPEVVLGRPHGKASDMWSAGVLLHVLLSGSQPFLGTGDRLRYAICNGELHVSLCLHKKCLVPFWPILVLETRSFANSFFRNMERSIIPESIGLSLEMH